MVTKAGSPLDSLVLKIKKNAERQDRDLFVKVIDEKEINKRCGIGYLREFKKILSLTNQELLFFVFREDTERNFWCSAGENAIVVNFARLPTLQDLREAEEEALSIETERLELFS